MTPLIELALKMSVFLALALAVATWSRRRSAALTHLILAAGVVGAAAVPLAQAVAPRWSIPALSIADSIGADDGDAPASPRAGVDVRLAIAAAPSAAEESSAASTLFAGAFAVWVAGSGLAALLLAAGFARLSALRRRARPVSDRRVLEIAAAIARDYRITRPVALLESATPPVLATWGWLRPVVMLPSESATWPITRLRIVLAHEFAHVHRGDSALQTLASCLCAALWFNPLAWVVSRRLQDESERACDDLVIGRGVDPADYAEALLTLARQLPGSPSWMSAPAMARSCSLERRVTAMFDVHLARHTPTRSLRTVLVLLVMLLAATIGGYRAAAQGFATFSGEVRDTRGGHLGGATVVLTNRASGQKYEVKSNDGGVYELVGVAAGDYDLQVLRPGFKTFSGRQAVVAGAMRENVTLDIGSLEETIMVRGGGGRAEMVAPRAQAQRTPASPPQAAPCRAPAAGGQLKQPVKLKDARPVYPEALNAAKVGGTLRFNATIAVDGSVREVVPLQAENPELASAAIDAIRQWRFSQTLLNCEPVEVGMTVSVSFTPE